MTEIYEVMGRAWGSRGDLNLLGTFSTLNQVLEALGELGITELVPSIKVGRFNTYNSRERGKPEIVVYGSEITNRLDLKELENTGE